MGKAIKKQYELLRKKRGLPAFAELDSEFEISSIESEGFLLREIRRKIIDKVHEVSAMAEEAMHPDTNLADMYESRVFNESEKQRLFELYKRLMAASRQSSELAIESSDRLEASFINAFYLEWKSIKPELLKFARKLREAWQKETDEAEKAGYMG